MPLRVDNGCTVTFCFADRRELLASSCAENLFHDVGDCYSTVLRDLVDAGGEQKQGRGFKLLTNMEQHFRSN